MANLASIYKDQGRWKEAEDLYVLVLRTMKRVLGGEHPDTLTTMSNLAFMWKDLGKDNKALALLEQCIGLRTDIIGIDHPDTKSSIEAFEQWGPCSLN